jgi:hypothetical protein
MLVEVKRHSLSKDGCFYSKDNLPADLKRLIFQPHPKKLNLSSPLTNGL